MIELADLFEKIENRIRLSVDPKLATEIGSTTYFMTEHEKDAVYRLKLNLPTFGEEKEAARQRIQAHLLQRKLKRRKNVTIHD